MAVPLPPVAPAEALVGDTVYEQGAAACVMVTGCPAIVRVPVLVAAVVLAATLNVVVPLPVPFAPDRIDIQVTLLTAVHAHPADAETETVVLAAPPEGADALVGATVYEQEAADWVTVMFWPATVNVPVRSAPLFTAAVNPTDPSPLPVAPDVMDSHAALLAAVHVHPAP